MKTNLYANITILCGSDGYWHAIITHGESGTVHTTAPFVDLVKLHEHIRSILITADNGR